MKPPASNSGSLVVAMSPAEKAPNPNMAGWSKTHRGRHSVEIAERARLASLKKHGATGVPPNMGPLEATRQGTCMKCSGIWGPLYLHIPSHYPSLPREEALRQYRKDCKIPEGVHLAADWHRARLSEGQSKRMQGSNGGKVRARIAARLSRPRPDLRGRTGRNPSGVVINSWPITQRLTCGKNLVE